VARAGVRRAFVEGHADIAAESGLDRHGLTRAEKHRCAVDVILKVHAFLGDLAKAGEGEDLESAGVGEDGAVPSHKSMQPAEVFHHFHAGADEEVIGIAQDDLRSERFELIGRAAFAGGLRADGHEDGCLDRAVARDEASAPGLGRGVNGEEREGAGRSVGHEIWVIEDGMDKTDTTYKSYSSYRSYRALR